LLEEVEETGDDYLNLMNALDNLWVLTKSAKGHPHVKGIFASDIGTDRYGELVRTSESYELLKVQWAATNMILELIQVLAMTEKWKQSFKEGDTNVENQED